MTCLKYDSGKLQNPPVLHQPMKRTVDTDSQLWLRLCSGHLPVCATSPETGTAPHLDGRMDFNPPFSRHRRPFRSYLWRDLREQGCVRIWNPVRLIVPRRRWFNIRRIWQPPRVTRPIFAETTLQRTPLRGEGEAV
jgi:hypothetical protein